MSAAEIQLNPQKVLLFRVLALLVPVLVLGIVELALRVTDTLPSRDVFVSALLIEDAYVSAPINDESSPKYQKLNHFIGERYFSGDGRVPTPWQKERFLEDKPDNGFRVFMLGDSTITGWPYDPHVAVGRILELRLRDAMPDKFVEVVTVGVPAFGSFSLLDMLDEVLEQEPDVILLYTGHNEYYGAMGAASTARLGDWRWAVSLNLWLQQFKTVQLIKQGVHLGRETLSGSNEDRPSREPLMRQVAGNRAILPGDEIYERGRVQFEQNLEAIFERANDTEVPLIVADLVSNLRDTEPFASIEMQNGESAEKAWLEARALDNQANFVEAKQAYTRAKDLDPIRFRAPEDFESIIRDVAAEYAVQRVSLRRHFDEAAQDGIPGNDLFLEHLHPTFEGQLLMSEAFLEGMIAEGLLEGRQHMADLPPMSHYRADWPVTELDHALAHIRTLALKDSWPFQPQGTPTSFALDFIPSSKAEEWAKQIFLGKATYKQAQNELALAHLESQDVDAALKSYRALTTSSPYDVAAYDNAALVLITKQQVNAAIPFLEKSVELNNGFVANKWLGQALIHTNSEIDGLPFLERAKQLQPTDVQLLSNLFTVYVSRGSLRKAASILDELEASQPELPALPAMRAHLERISATDAPVR